MSNYQIIGPLSETTWPSKLLSPSPSYRSDFAMHSDTAVAKRRKFRNTPRF
jgi:hypothetical protein